MTFDTELDTMKRYPLTEIAAALGYVQNKRKSTRSLCVMQHETNGHKVIVSLRTNGHWTFYTIGGTAKDAGTFIDLLQMAKGSRFSLGDCRKFMRPFVGGTIAAADRPNPKHYASSLLPTAADVEQARNNFARYASPLLGGRHAYLNEVRGLTPDYLTRPLFVAAVYQDRLGNAFFPHRDKAGEITGYAIRGPQFKSFSKGGTKSLWYADCGPEKREIICIGEAAISVLSHGLLFPSSSTCYLSTEGGMSPVQRELILSAISKLPMSGQIVIAADHDDAGHQFANTLIELWSQSAREDAFLKVHQPEPGFDWNDALLAQAQPVSSTPRFAGRVPNRPRP